MPITEQQLLRIIPNAGRHAGVFVPVLNTAMIKHGIVTPARIAAFIAQIGHESGQLARLVENLNYSADALMRTWPSRFDRMRATAAARKPKQIASIAYGGRMGNTAPGDGWKYRGRGLIQITGKNNYVACGEALVLDLIEKPELLEQPQHAAMSAAWFWASNGLNSLADTGALNAITQRINGGQNGAAGTVRVRFKGAAMTPLWLRILPYIAAVAVVFGAAWQIQVWRYEAKISMQAVLHQQDLTSISNAAAAQARAEQSTRLDLEQRLSASEQTHHKELSDAQTNQARLRDRLATADVRLSVLFAEDSASCSAVPATSGADGVVHGRTRAQLDPAHAQRIIAITDAGDRGLIALRACQAYAREISGRK